MQQRRSTHPALDAHNELMRRSDDQQKDLVKIYSRNVYEKALASKVALSYNAFNEIWVEGVPPMHNVYSSHSV